MSLTIVVNPAAGRGRARRVFAAAARFLDRLRVDFQAVFTEGPGHAVFLAREAARSGSGAVVACGGDGTAHEVINGINGWRGAVGFIPCGTGNDLAANLGIPSDPRTACSVLAEGAVRTVDLARTEERLFACVAGAGFDSKVNRAANSRAGFLRGTSVYVWSLLSTLASFRAPEMTVVADGAAWTGRAMFTVVANAASYGGGMKIAPLAHMGDGLLDLIIVEEISRAELLRVFPSVFSGGHLSHPRVRHLRAKRVNLSSTERLELFGDGEYIADLPVSVEILPLALRVIVPRSRTAWGPGGPA